MLYIYYVMWVYFLRDNVVLKGFVEYFKCEVLEECEYVE